MRLMQIDLHTFARSFARFTAFIGTMLLISGILGLSCPISVEALEISLQLNVAVEKGNAVVSLQNRGREAAEGIYLELEMQEEVFGACMRAPIRPGERSALSVQLPPRAYPGSYVAASRASYLNDGGRLGVAYATTVNYGEASVIPNACRSRQMTMRNSSTVTVSKPPAPGVFAQLFLPSHIPVAKLHEDATSAGFFLRNTLPRFRSDSSAYFTFENLVDGKHSAAVCEGHVNTVQQIQESTLFSSGFLLWCGMIATLLSVRWYAKNDEPGERERALIRWGFSVGMCSLFYLGFRHLGLVADLLGPFVESWRHSGKYPKVLQAIIPIVPRLYFVGGDFENFFRYVADLLYGYMLFLNFFILRYLIRPTVEKDKYWSLMARFYSSIYFRWLVRLFRGRGLPERESSFSRPLAKIAALAYLVKLFYVPMITSWTINNVSHLHALAGQTNWNFFSASRAAIDLMIFVDVAYFTVGYLVELPFLKNTIRSVEPTLLGWFVCLVCYPPFNNSFFSYFDHPVASSWPEFGEATRGAVTAATVVLWFIYTWASVALGLKASNLTNRGIVDRGPYRFVRHPAYAGKVTVWVLGVIFLGEGFGLNIFAAVCIYILRAITEERHLSADPEYVEYRKRVRWMFCPGIL